MSNRKHAIESYAAYWWTENTGETDRWEDLDTDEREAVIDNSYAQVVGDWLAEQWGVHPTPPPCSNHQERQHRDRQPPWCDSCGWSHGVTVPARQIR